MKTTPCTVPIHRYRPQAYLRRHGCGVSSGNKIQAEIDRWTRERDTYHLSQITGLLATHQLTLLSTDNMLEIRDPSSTRASIPQPEHPPLRSCWYTFLVAFYVCLVSLLHPFRSLLRRCFVSLCSVPLRASALVFCCCVFVCSCSFTRTVFLFVPSVIRPSLFLVRC